MTQVGRQVVKLNPSDLCLPSRAWKVKLLGEGADDAGGVFDDTITEMCQVMYKQHLESLVVLHEQHVTKTFPNVKPVPLSHSRQQCNWSDLLSVGTAIWCGKAPYTNPKQHHWSWL